MPRAAGRYGAEGQQSRFPSHTDQSSAAGANAELDYAEADIKIEEDADDNEDDDDDDEDNDEDEEKKDLKEGDIRQEDTKKEPGND